ncbi:ketopantoate reductase PanE/ApbA C terminal-domain-containing protein [Tricharina praecox]|uniref:ketopantoate reductase PanE/ApbA C terminal-domain-containing protein n=1 Tax=Tricharina praecox TaxID=43433 RepID=UPI00221FB852|nr:ketopantoate reductase PanE/ApbA C terminal-domain-containing protein [Tricharina praecox]KAI5845924.1 ketopantoate reductase PanE/ApbA C terminal-domain-containing protein [Tricharina praecox]
MSVPRIHILGGGNIGSFVAHGLRSLPSPKPEVTLLLRGTTYQTFLSRYSVYVEDVTTVPPTHSVRRITTALPSASTFLPTRIQNLVIATKTHQLGAALAPLIPRLTRESTVVFLQNGITPSPSQLFPDPYMRPRELWAGVVTHGINSEWKFSLKLAARGEIVLGPLGEGVAGDDARLRRKPLLVEALARMEGGRTVDTAGELLRCQLRKLAANAAINALAAVHDVKNGELLAMPEALETMRAAVREVGDLVKGMLGEDLVEGGEEALWKSVRDVVELTGENTCSMLQDLRAGKKTEIQEINGWVVEKATELGLDCKVNKELVEKVKALEREKGILEVEPVTKLVIEEQHPRDRRRVTRKVFNNSPMDRPPTVPGLARRVPV